MRHPKARFQLLKKFSVLLLSLVLYIQVFPQEALPKVIGIIMYGKSGKPILDIYLVDSSKKEEYKFDIHDIVIYADRITLANIYSTFKNERQYDRNNYYDGMFGTFLFSALLNNDTIVTVRKNRLKSITLFQKINSNLDSSNNTHQEIINKINYNISRIKSPLIRWDSSLKKDWKNYNYLRFNDNKSHYWENTFAPNILVEYEYKDSCLYYSVETIYDRNIIDVTDTTQEHLTQIRTSFNIIELFARKIRKLLQDNIKLNKNKSFIKSEIKSILYDSYRFRSKYNKKTNFSHKRKATERWQILILNELERLNSFSQFEYCNCR